MSTTNIPTSYVEYINQENEVPPLERRLQVGQDVNNCFPSPTFTGNVVFGPTGTASIPSIATTDFVLRETERGSDEAEVSVSEIATDETIKATNAMMNAAREWVEANHDPANGDDVMMQLFYRHLDLAERVYKDQLALQVAQDIRLNG